MKYHEVVTKKKGYNRLIREKALPIEIKSLKKSLKKLLKKSLKKSLLKIKRLTIFRPAKPLDIQCCCELWCCNSRYYIIH